MTGETSIATGGKIGFGVSGSTGYTPAVVDDFDGGNLSGGSPTVTPTSPSGSTPTPTPTPTPTTAGGCAVLDCFTGTNGPVSSNWTGNTGAFSISSNQLAGASGGAMYWANGFGADQQVSIKLQAWNTGQEIALYLKAVGGTHTNGVVEVTYAQNGQVLVHTYDSGNWAQFANWSTTFATGDVLKAQISAAGAVQVFKNGTLIGSVNVSASWGIGRAGQIGVYSSGSEVLLDDFDGGTVSGGGATSTPTPTTVPTQTPTPPPGGCAVLDCFTTSLSSSWAGDTASFSVSSSQLVAASDKAIYWNATYSGDVWASIKLNSLSANQVVALHLRAVSNYYTNGVIEVNYTQGGGVAIYTFDGTNWVQRGSTIATSFASGDVFKAVSLASGTVTVYKNGTSVGSASVTGWSGYNRDGQIGLWTDAGGALLDDFNGGSGTGAFVPGAAKVWAKAELPKQIVTQATPPTGGWTRSYYYFGGSRVAMRERTDVTNGTVTWHTDSTGHWVDLRDPPKPPKQNKNLPTKHYDLVHAMRPTMYDAGRTKTYLVRLL